jgi:hypothetical protein
MNDEIHNDESSIGRKVSEASLASLPEDRLEKPDYSNAEKLLYSEIMASTFDSFWVFSLNVNKESQIGGSYLTVEDREPGRLFFSAALAGAIASAISILLSLRQLRALNKKKQAGQALDEYEKGLKKSLPIEIVGSISLNSLIFLDAFHSLGVHQALKGTSLLFVQALGLDFASSLFVGICLLRVMLSVYRYEKAQDALDEEKRHRADLIRECLGEKALGCFNRFSPEAQHLVIKHALSLSDDEPPFEFKEFITTLGAALNDPQNHSIRKALFQSELRVHQLEDTAQKELLNVGQNVVALAIILTFSFYPPLTAISIVTMVSLAILRLVYDVNQRINEEVSEVKLRQGACHVEEGGLNNEDSAPSDCEEAFSEAEKQGFDEGLAGSFEGNAGSSTHKSISCDDLSFHRTERLQGDPQALRHLNIRGRSQSVDSFFNPPKSVSEEDAEGESEHPKSKF